MTQEEKQLLLKDLCARLTYDVVVEYTAGDGSATIDCHIDCISIRSQCVGIMDNPDKPFVWRDIISIKPYLRPMSSMTDKEKKKFDKYMVIDEDAWMNSGVSGYINQSKIMSSGIDWLNAHHFDYRGLIPMGLALEAPEGMYN